MKGDQRNLQFNITFWALYFLYEWLGNGTIECEFEHYFAHASVLIPTAFLTCYLSVHIVFKRYYFSNRVLFWILEVLIGIVFVMIRRTANFYFIYPTYTDLPPAWESFLFPPKLIIEFVNLYLFVGLYVMFHSITAWYTKEKEVQQLLQAKSQAELELLKSQVHPHFIFNTLNNLYSISIAQNPQTAKYLMKLAALLDYSLYVSKKEYVPLPQEIDILESYIALQKLRFGENVDVLFQKRGDLSKRKIAPLLLLPLVENCFKHGTEMSSEKMWIAIDIESQSNYVTIKIENSKEDSPLEQQRKNGGLGIENVKKRLQLLYDGLHELKIFNEPDTFLVVLKIRS